MTEACTVNSSIDENKCLDNSVLSVKEEEEVTVKQEFVECLVCLSRTTEHCDLNKTTTAAGTTLFDYLCKFTQADLTKTTNGSGFICKTCLNLVNILEHAEIEYLKVKEEFESLISKNPLFETQNVQASAVFEQVKNENSEVFAENKFDNDSEDEPLSLTKKKRYRKLDKRKKKSVADVKRKENADENVSNEKWECAECDINGETGGAMALTAHMLLSHTLSSATNIEKIKKEESPDRDQSENFNVIDSAYIVEVEGYDDDDESSTYIPDELSNGKHKRSKLLSQGTRKTRKNSTAKKKKDPKVIHECDQCNAKYTSLVRLEHHKQKHSDAKPPYICEVCGARYKHKRACDVHVAMHRGISDWKCAECDKLFPSKGALQRHNNIHTGKLNYQCDLCGKSFIHTSSFKMHKLSHSGVKPHACDVCGLALMTRSHLKRHKRVHSGEKRHECAVCGKRFSERYNLAAHARAHAGAGVGDSAIVNSVRRKLFRCAFCPERFEVRSQLERHAGVAHGRALERPPPTPRNTMSKLLKAQAQRRDLQQTGAVPQPQLPSPADTDIKGNRSPETKPLSVSSHKHLPQHSSSDTSGSVVASAAGGASSWAGVYAAEFGLRTDYTH